MDGRRLLGALAAIPLLLVATPAYAAAGPNPGCQFQYGFATMVSLIPNVVGSCINDQQVSNPLGDTMQETTNGLLTWTRATNVVEFTTGSKTWVYSGYGLVLRDGSTSYSWEGATSLVAGIAIDKDGHAIDPLTGRIIPTDARTKAI